MNRFKLVVIVCIAIAIFGFLLTAKNKKSISPDHAIDVQTVMDAAISPSIPPNSIARSKPDVVALNDSADFLDLPVGQKFSLKGNIPNSQIRIVLQVVNKSVSPGVTIISASSDSGLTSIITLTESLTNILVKTANNTFEYSGSEFMGVVDPIRNRNLSEDIYLDKMQEMILLDDAITEIRLEP